MKEITPRAFKENTVFTYSTPFCNRKGSAVYILVEEFCGDNCGFVGLYRVEKDIKKKWTIKMVKNLAKM